MQYDGGKNAVWRQIVNQLPPHSFFYEVFGGSGALIRHKRPALENIYVERDPAIVAAVTPELERVASRAGSGVVYRFLNADAIEILTSLLAWPAEKLRATVIYVDPPYLMETRSYQGQLYEHEFGSAEQHEALIGILTSLSACGARIVISGYASQLYAFRLAGWRRVDFSAMTHRGPRTESLWCNFPEPTDLHDKRFVGSGWRERQRIQRKKARMVSRLSKLPPLEFAVLKEAVEKIAAARAVSGVVAG